MRVTQNDLQAAVNLLNRLTGHNEEPYTKREDGSYVSNPGTYYIAGAYGGWKLEQMIGTSGGCTDALSTGFVSRRELYEAITNFRKGVEVGKRMAADVFPRAS